MGTGFLCASPDLMWKHHGGLEELEGGGGGRLRGGGVGVGVGLGWQRVPHFPVHGAQKWLLAELNAGLCGAK